MLENELLKKLAKLGELALDVHQDAYDLVEEKNRDYAQWSEISNQCYRIQEGYSDVEGAILREPNWSKTSD